MGRLLKLGCLGLLGFVLLLAVVGIATSGGRQQGQVVSGGAQAGGSQAGGSAGGAEPKAGGAQPKAELAKVGQTASRGGWEVTVLDFGPYERFSAGKAPGTPPQGRLLVVDMRIKNLQNSTSNFTTNDFALKAADGREFKPSAQTATIDRGFVISQTVQPGLVTENRVVFDVDPAVKEFTFTALGTQWQLALAE